jgi:hypothetical protein
LTKSVRRPTVEVATGRVRERAVGEKGGEELVEVKSLVVAIVKAMVDHPEQVMITEVEGDHSSVLELTVAPEDIGQVIGKRGVHAEAIRRLVHAIGGKHRRKYVLGIVEK